ncbi:hypothetical protein SteCoe_31366 [Stentor coeruleus]|uniref:Uncharacterized protein n=1 Tax=Stentor coeruleus TaxID=5963 RepID=A0A1R2B1G7_9CILI|nr:hypothetical protein SteCoe_31366 [Stentor coeruleus]
MKLQQKLETSLDDIIKINKKKPGVSNKSKGITRTGTEKLKRLKQLNKRGPKVNKNREQKPDKPKNTPKPGQFNRKPKDSDKKNKNRPEKPRGQPATKKWAAPKRGSRFNRKFRGRNRN